MAVVDGAEELEFVGAVVVTASGFVVADGSVGDLSAASPQATTDTVMSNARSRRRIEVFTLLAIVARARAARGRAAN